MNNSTSPKKERTTKKLVTCTSCKKGVMLPLNPDAEVNYCYKCSYCGEMIIIELPVEVK
ncbi:MAG: hypothetical protein ACOX4I_00350 [Anaerovoracaceae bacterium]|jgi:predicted RNA-binding Zn-ribbon protein involved in translation (DUF1610 family)